MASPQNQLELRAPLVLMRRPVPALRTHEKKQLTAKRQTSKPSQQQSSPPHITASISPVEHNRSAEYPATYDATTPANALAVPRAVPVAEADVQTPLVAAVQQARPDHAYSPPPQYPISLREKGICGVVWLRIWVDRNGLPAEIRVAKGSGYRLFDDAALRAVERWRFVPARSGENSLASWVEFAVRFTLSG